MRAALAASLICILPALCLGNDTAVVGEGGRVRLLKGEHASVRMVRESVRLDIYPDWYDVDAVFTFRNEGGPVSVRMGFPESGGGDIRPQEFRKKSGFLRFATWVDGQPARARRVFVDVEEKGASGYQAHWVKDVGFAAGQERTVRVRYRSRPHEVSDGTSFAAYEFTGGNWRGTVGESTMVISVHLPGTCLAWWYKPALTRRGNQFFFRRENWQAEERVSLHYVSTMAGWLHLAGCGEAPSPPEGAVTLTQPGRQRRLDWAPPAVLRNGVCFASLQALQWLLAEQANRAGQARRAAIGWDAKAKEAVFQAGAHVLRFRPGRPAMAVDGKGEVALPAAAFVSPPTSGRPAGVLYVPLRPVAEELGGTVHLEYARRRVHLDIPPFWQARSRPAD